MGGTRFSVYAANARVMSAVQSIFTALMQIGV
jgi:flagellar hook-associated protein FlgK